MGVVPGVARVILNTQPRNKFADGPLPETTIASAPIWTARTSHDRSSWPSSTPTRGPRMGRGRPRNNDNHGQAVNRLR